MDIAPGDLAWDHWEARIQAAGVPATGAPATPMLHLDGFDGPMDLLHDLAERQKIDLGRMSILALAEQFVAAMEQFGDHVAIERRADWLVMATRLVLLRSRLLFPESPAAVEAAQRDAATELRRIDDLAGMRAAVNWLSARPVLGQDVFTRGAPERLDVHLVTDYAVDVIAFLWASLSLFDDDVDELEAVARYRPVWADLFSVTEARDRILRLLGEGGDGEALSHFLPEDTATTNGGDPPALFLRRSSAWAITFSAGLELAKLGDVVLAQAEAFASVNVRSASEPLSPVHRAGGRAPDPLG
jgi:segregation and condensation protein A